MSWQRAASSDDSVRRHTRARRQWGRSLLASVFLLGVLGVANQANAVYDTGIFQLDRNAETSDNPAAPPAAHDWDQVCNDATPNASTPELCTGAGTSGAGSVAFETDGVGQTIFTGAQPGGGSKDPDLIAGWRHKSGSVPDKDELLHGYAARYSATPDEAGPTLCPAGTNTTCEVVFFGADRFDTSGDAQIGFWFFQNRISVVAPPAGSTVGSFSGEHKDGDLLVLSNFTQGGGTPNIQVLRWNYDPDPKNPNDDGALPGGGTGKCSASTCDNLELLAGGSSPADCVGPPQVGTGAGFCATVNNEQENAPWPFLDKGAYEDFQAGEFYEGGINLSLLPGSAANSCFSSFSVETRSSTSPTAVLKDFVLGNFGTCSAAMTTTPSTSVPVAPGTSVTDLATVTGSNANVTPTGNVTFYLCSTAVTSTDLCTSGGTQVGSPAALSGTGAVATATSAAVNTSSSPLTPGRYCFRAEWPGDTNYVGALSHTAQNECFTVAKLNTNTVTTPVDASGTQVTDVLPGTVVRDRAVVTGTSAGGDPTGNVNFFVCTFATGSTATCDGTATKEGTAVTPNPKALVSDGVATFTSIAVSGDFAPTAEGRYCFRAEYLGSTIYNPSADSAATECFTVTKLPSNTVTTPVDASGTPVTDVLPGTVVRDRAVVTGTSAGGDPTGNVNFFVCTFATGSTATCDGTATKEGTAVTPNPKALVSDDVPETFTASAFSGDFAPTAEGRYCFRAEYLGSTIYNPSADSAATECFTVTKLPSNTVTTPVISGTPITTTVTPGTAVQDRAVVTGTSAGGDPTGTVSFWVCFIAEGTCDGTTNRVGSPVTPTKNLVSDNVAETFTSAATSGDFAPTAEGRYCFRAEYSGSTVYKPSADSATTECFTVTKLPSNTVTTPRNGTTAVTTVTLGTTVNDLAVVTGTAAGGDPTGDVNFYICALIATGTCDGTNNVGTAVAGNPKTLVSDGVAGTYTSSVASGNYTPAAVGRYCFRAEYLGSTIYLGSSDSSATECFTVTDSTSITSAQKWLPNDSATLTSAGGAPMSGTLSFTLYESDNCTGTVLRAAEEFTLNATTAPTSPVTRSTNNTTVFVEQTKTVSWKVVFTSTNGNITGSNHCEKTVLTITN